MPLKKHTGKGL